MFVLKIIREILKISHLFMTRKASSGLCGHIAHLSTENDECRLCYNFWADKKIRGYFLLPSDTLLIDVHAVCLLIHRMGGKHTCCWLGVHNEAGQQIKSQGRSISLANLLCVTILVLCRGQRPSLESSLCPLPPKIQKNPNQNKTKKPKTPKLSQKSLRKEVPATARWTWWAIIAGMMFRC